MRKLLVILVLGIVLSLGCNNSSRPLLMKFHPNDPFKSIVESEYFDINAKADTVVEGENGTRLVLPKGCFKNSKGEIVEDHIKVELAEALNLEDMLLSNLTTTAGGKLLETDGMIYINATSNGEQLTINLDNPIYIEIPTAQRKPSMMAYKGIRDENGNMNWVEPKELDKFLVPVDINLLNFFPEGFESEVEQGMPFRNHIVATKELKDSLYYSLSVWDGMGIMGKSEPFDFNEPYYNKNKEIKDGKYTKESYDIENIIAGAESLGVATYTTNLSASFSACCGIDPAIIKTIRSEKFQNTLIATREFETRLQVIFKTCMSSILEIYIKNLDKNLWELDSMVANILDTSILLKYTPEYATLLNHFDFQQQFRDFSQQRLTNVEGASKRAGLLKAYYEKRLSKIKSELESAKEKVKREMEKHDAKVEKVVDEYKELLWKREKYRMENYGFEWTDVGWINVDIGTIPKWWGPQRLEIFVDEGKSFDQVYTYVIYTSIKSLYRLNSSDKELFYVGNADEREMLMPNKSKALAIAIAYKGDAPYLAYQEFETGTDNKLSLTLSQSSKEQIKKAIRPFDNYNKENKISKDLKYMEFFAQEKKKQDKLREEQIVKQRLWNKAFPCCAYGEVITETITQQ